MSRNIRKLEMKDLPEIWRIANLSYPPYGDKEAKREKYLRRALSERTSGEFYGCFEAEEMVGCLELYDFRMNLRGCQIQVGGVGFIAVDIFHKRQGVAGEMLAFCERYFRERQIPVLVLYPYSIRFYHKRGFCCATRMYQYRILPDMFPYAGPPKHVRMLGQDDRKKLTDCFAAYFANTNGMLMKRSVDIDALLEDTLIAAYERDGVVEGYAAYRYEKVDPNCVHMDNMVVSEWVWNSREAFLELCSFFHAQSDQITRVILNTPEENLYLSLLDPANGLNGAFQNETHEMYVAAADSMYKVLDAKNLFAQIGAVNFNGANLRLWLTLLGPDGSEELGLKVEDGTARISEEGPWDAMLRMPGDVFTAMVTGATDFAELHALGLAEIDRADQIMEVSKLFAYPRRPKTITYF